MRGPYFAARAAVVRLIALAGMAGIASGACVVTTIQPPPRAILVSGPPPAVVLEDRRPPSPAPQASWIAGYWHWTGIQYAWIPGHWVASPPTGSRWHAPLYVQSNGAYFYEPAGWTPIAPAASAAAPPPTAAAFH